MSDGAAWAAVVVNYNAGPLLVDAVTALLADDSAGQPQVVVVDNASTDGSLDALRRSHPSVTVLEPRANLGYARAANLGIAATDAPVVAVCNPDTVVAPGAGAVAVAAFAADPELAALGPRISNVDGSTYPSARIEPGFVTAVGHATLGRVAPHNRWTARYRQSAQDPATARDVDWLSGAFLWFRRAFLDRIGGWDERFFLFMEDVDVCREVRAAGGRVRYEPAASVRHLEGASRAAAPLRSVAAHHRSVYRYLDKWWVGPRRALLPAAAGFLAVRAGCEALAAGSGAGGRPGSRHPTG